MTLYRYIGHPDDEAAWVEIVEDVMVPVVIDYEAATQAIKDAWLIDDRHTTRLISLVRVFVDAALVGVGEETE